MLNIVIPMAGRGSRFANEGYKLPKPLIQIHDKPMIAYVIKNLKPKCEHRFIFICLKEHIERFSIDRVLKELEPNCEIVIVNEVTQGAACTVLLTEKYINNNDSLMIANSDQYVDIDINEYLQLNKREDTDGFIMTMKANDDKWSFIKYDSNNFVTMVKEKEVISDQATVGIYNYKKGADFVKCAKEMIAKNDRIKNEFYVAPVYNYMISDKKKIAFYDIGDLGSGMYGLGVPDDLKYFVKLKLSINVSRSIDTKSYERVLHNE